MPATDGTYSGQLCTHLKDKPRPLCWPAALVVRNGIAEGNWSGASNKMATAKGTIAPNGALELKLTASFRADNASEAVLVGRVADGAFTASGQWRNGLAVEGSWKRTQ